MTDHLLVSTENISDKEVRTILQQAVKTYFLKLINDNTDKNLADVIIVLDVYGNRQVLNSMDRVSGKIITAIATVRYTETAFTITSKYIEDATITDGSFIICLN